ncbi:DUF3105 domain-containing protein [Haloglycomyces albus]|uniref:DUF3105 domain-containing protein n=1 Tax=Haloglycomyces albus TaxID=526067 RepID=UPI00046CFD86|nr:DUF3105 domain-containing protein [Haloglycomyces albus]
MSKRNRSVLLIPLLAAVLFTSGSPGFFGWGEEDDPLETANVVNYYGEWGNITELVRALNNGELEPADHPHPWVATFQHVDALEREFSDPPAGGAHFPVWQNCMGRIYEEPIENGHAIHSLEHGAIWLTYDPAALSAQDISLLERRVTDRPYSMMSPFPGQSSPVIVTAWGMQLFTDNAGDPAIDAFADTYAQNAETTPEPGATCGNGIK